MSESRSKFAPMIAAMTEYRVALGMSAHTLSTQLKRFDRYCAEKRPEHDAITKELVFDWLAELAEDGSVNVNNHCSAIRQLAEYMNAVGEYAYVLPDGFYPYKPGFTAYVFSDAELSALFAAMDSLPMNPKNNEALVAPVLFRLIYTCGLRPNEGRELRRERINFETGEILITNTKKKKDRLVVMSPDMLSLCREFDNRRSPSREYFFAAMSGNAYSSAQI
jgi:integrase